MKYFVMISFKNLRTSYKSIERKLHWIIQIVSLNMGVHFPKDEEEFLKRLVSTGALDDLGLSAVQSNYRAHFRKLKTRSFANKLLVIRKELGNRNSKSNRKSKFAFSV